MGDFTPENTIPSRTTGAIWAQFSTSTRPGHQRFIKSELRARLSHPVDGGHVDAVRPAGTDQDSSDSHALTGKGVQPSQDELQRHGPAAERTSCILWNSPRLVDAYEPARIR